MLDESKDRDRLGRHRRGLCKKWHVSQSNIALAQAGSTRLNLRLEP